MLCTKCNYDNPADARFCIKCGTKVENRCSSCSTVNPVEANFCRKCGAALASAASLIGSTTAAKTQHVEVVLEQRTGDGLEGERKTVTALFADIKGSMVLMRDLDPEEARDRGPGAQDHGRRGPPLRGLRRAIDRRWHLCPVRRAAGA
jgi:ribosomal protein L40E